MRKVALFGNPNTGKSSLFNRLTGLNQKIGNFPGVTIDKSTGKLHHNNVDIQIIDLPGTYSVYPRSNDEKVVYDILSNKNHKDYPELAVVVLDATNLERNLLLCTQVYELGLPTVIVLNMTDVAHRKKLIIDSEKLNTYFPNAQIVRCNARIGSGIPELKDLIATYSKSNSESKKELIAVDNLDAQALDVENKFRKIKVIYADVVEKQAEIVNFSGKVDRWLTHPVFGYLFFFALLLIIFQSVFTLAAYPMDWIDSGFSALTSWIHTSLPPGLLTDLLADGLIAGIGGVVIFLPQIMLLFFLLGILEETGYMARVVFIMDKLVRPFGLNGKSVVPLISSAACAIPGIMAARTISSWKERITTIMVSPLMSCSARIPVYTLLISLIIPNKTVGGIFNLQGLVLFGMYALGLFAALLVAFILKKILRSKELSVFLLELPDYKSPRWGNVFLDVYKKGRIFLFDAGKIIIAISIILWAGSTFGPGNSLELAEKQALARTKNQSEEIQEEAVASAKLEASYIGYLGKGIEPVIKPLGYDWKMGIALITSFAAREVFVGSLSTIYSVHQEDDNQQPLIEKMRDQKHSNGKPVFTFASGMSLLIFYAFAMQCMATLAVVKRETKSWKWPLIQLGYMGAMAYLGALITFQLLK